MAVGSAPGSSPDNARGEAAVGSLFPTFASNPALHLHRVEPIREAALLVCMDEAAYRRESFLTDRMLTPETLGAWVPLFRILEATETQERGGRAAACHFIFHQGHTGSTLVSRLLDETGAAFGLREPWPLLTLAELADTLGGPDSLYSDEQFARLQAALLTVWARTFRPGTVPIVKATSHAGRIGAELLRAAPAARALSLHLQAEPYLATLLGGANSPLDLRGFAQERMRRITRLFGPVSPPLHALSTGELAAMAWLAERGSQARFLHNSDLAARCLDVDFDAFLETPEPHLTRIAQHFGLNVGADAIRAAVTGPVMTRYSKSPDRSYSPALRRQILDETRVDAAGEIRRGLSWLEAAAKKSKKVGALLAGG